uniref:DUF6824 domain-containing protein n=1 Tax=Amphora coffeiformis TaxID=265554 RepID=A0A7S3P3M5_9STRA
MSRRHKEGTRDEMMAQIVHPASQDVILGRGSLHAWHPGNMMFLKRVEECVTYYENAKTKSAKTQIIQEIYDGTAGRFLVRAPESDQFIEISEPEAKEKISQIIRYRKLVASQKGETDQSGDDESAGLGGSGIDNDKQNEDLDDISSIELPDTIRIKVAPVSEAQRPFGEVSGSVAEAHAPASEASPPANDAELFSDEELLSVLGWFLDPET